MKISTEIYSAANHVGEEKAIELLAKAGFNAWDFSMFNMRRFDWQSQSFFAPIPDHPLVGPDYLAFARKLKKIGEDNGIHCNQSHAPFPSTCPAMLPWLKRAIECTAEAGGDICIIHPENNKNGAQNAEMYHELLEFAKPMGVKIATENMFNWDSVKNVSAPAACSSAESFLEHFAAVNDDAHFVACLDIGHAEMRDGAGPGAELLVRALGPHLQALHIHDNDGHADNHQIPFSMGIDYAPIVKAMKDIGYPGYFTLEADSYLGKFTKDNVFEGIKDLAASAKRLADMFENA